MSKSKKVERVRPKLVCKEPSLTANYEASHCDVNQLVENAKATGVLNHVSPKELVYSAFDQNASYHDALNSVIATQEAFMSHPAAIRSKFDNDPGKMVEYLSNPDNLDEAIDLGLVRKKDVSTPGS